MTGRACRYCKSPAVKNPCWYYLDNPQAAGGGDPPCDCDPDYDEPRHSKKVLARFVIVGIGVVLFVATMLWQYRKIAI